MSTIGCLADFCAEDAGGLAPGKDDKEKRRYIVLWSALPKNLYLNEKYRRKSTRWNAHSGDEYRNPITAKGLLYSAPTSAHSFIAQESSSFFSSSSAHFSPNKI